MDAAVPPGCHVHAMIRQDGSYLMLHSERFGYYKFPDGQAAPAETPVQTLCRIVSAQTGLTVLPESIRLHCQGSRDAEDGSRHRDLYYRCAVTGEPSAALAENGRFRLTAVPRSRALAANRNGSHGILSDDARFRAMLARENAALGAFSIPLLLSIAALAGSLLIPLTGGLSCLLFGFHSPTDGGMVYGWDAVAVGMILGIFPAGPPAAVSIAALAVSLVNRHRLLQKKSAYILPGIAIAMLLLFGEAAFSLGNL